jgi:hypothetical protein
MRKYAVAVGLCLAFMSAGVIAGDNDNNAYGDVHVVGNGTGTVSISQCASTWNCNNSELNVSFGDGVKTVLIDGKNTVIKGADGTNGKDGVNGKDGLQGIQGIQGIKGDTGANGLNGTNGTDGKNGIDGINGADGTNGINGTNGKDGINGVDGKDGIAGTNGTNGSDGKNGKDGVKGDTGNTGEQGLQGVAGINGLNGKDADMTQVNTATQTSKAANNRVAALEQSTNQRFSDMGKRIDDNRDHASAGVAGVAAMANIPQVSQNSSFSVGAGVGSYDGEQGLAVGASARFNQNVVTKASVAATTQDDFVFGAGMSVEW